MEAYLALEKSSDEGLVLLFQYLVLLFHIFEATRPDGTVGRARCAEQSPTEAQQVAGSRQVAGAPSCSRPSGTEVSPGSPRDNSMSAASLSPDSPRRSRARFRRCRRPAQRPPRRSSRRWRGAKASSPIPRYEMNHCAARPPHPLATSSRSEPSRIPDPETPCARGLFDRCRPCAEGDAVARPRVGSTADRRQLRSRSAPSRTPTAASSQAHAAATSTVKATAPPR